MTDMRPTPTEQRLADYATELEATVEGGGQFFAPRDSLGFARAIRAVLSSLAEARRERDELRRWLGQHLKFEAGAKRRLYLRPDNQPDKRHFGTPDEAINAALSRISAGTPTGELEDV